MNSIKFYPRKDRLMNNIEYQFF